MKVGWQDSLLLYVFSVFFTLLPLLLAAAPCRLPAAVAIMLALMVSNSKSVQLY